MLIDGYNLIHKWPELRRDMRRGGEVARARPAEAIRVIHDFDGVRTTIVFDGRGEQVEIERPGSVCNAPVGLKPANSSSSKS